MGTGSSQSERQRILVQREISRRIQKNPKCSLRSFARVCGVSHTVLSLFLSGKRPLSRKAARRLLPHLNLTPEQANDFIAFSGAESGLALSMDQFEHISNWHGLAILSLLELPAARFDAGWISERLSIQEIEARDSMERLVRLGLVERNSAGRWRQAVSPIRFDKRGATSAARTYNSQLLEKAIQSLEEDSGDLRDFSSITFAFNADEIEMARSEISKFRRRLCSKLEAKGKPREVYSLAIQLFPVSRPEKGLSV